MNFFLSFLFLILLIKISISDSQKESVCDITADVIFLLDHSQSVLPSDWQEVENFVNDGVDKLKISPNGARAGIIQFAGTAVLTMCLTGTKCAIEIGLSNQPTIGTTTNLVEALSLAKQTFDQQGRDGQKIAILLTDGNDNHNSASDIIAAANSLKNDDVDIYCIGVDNNSTNKEDMMKALEAISSQPPQNYVIYVQQGFAGLTGMLDDLLNNSCEDETKTRCPAALIMLAILLLLHLFHLLPIFQRQPKVQKYTYWVHYLALFFTVLSFILICGMISTSDPKKQSKICTSVIVFLSFAIAGSIAVIFILWRNQRAIAAQKGISKAGLAALESADSTPAGMNTFRKEETKVDQPYSKITDDLDSHLFHGDN
ncbi:hypothetical protein M0811_04608 [Anaeramoeba ignava]|uniref:VWFA domain-containing protein n=1 Tax=Anaeramoeba ignava TaxID=1746090 RepID=A0A9Q0LW01_ANAIG|nr:hypothetical protein M0811_12204 [Anaeramoeba ignava]KAJ5078885.1 hypothetical protein M0811_04608 [Anaeramoeba ignava]|eukprot:Anaeramoba_ignava/a481128_94.p1 GENE.a481128_94~~a481128_94.p1  ORF type:complete len:371 (-),score=79.35 a481128_94:23-1135(-)